MLRTHNCGELTEKDLDKEVTLCGWVHKRRDHGKLIFIDIRDRYGLTQAVFIPQKSNPELHAKASILRSEFVILLKGKVQTRPKGTENQKLPTGNVEIFVMGLEILNPAPWSPST